MVEGAPIIKRDVRGRVLCNSDKDLAVRIVYNSNDDAEYVGIARPDTDDNEESWQVKQLTYDANNNLSQVLWPQDSSGDETSAYKYYWDNGTNATITGITQADPGVVTTSAAHGFEDGDYVIIESVVGMTEVNWQNRTDRLYIVANKTSTTFELTDVDGANVDTSGFTAYSSAGTTHKPDWANYTFG